MMAATSSSWPRILGGARYPFETQTFVTSAGCQREHAHVAARSGNRQARNDAAVRILLRRRTTSWPSDQ